jgi:hypothetical protein
MAWLLILLSSASANLSNFNATETVHLGSYSGSLSKQSVVLNKYYLLSIASSDSNTTYLVHTHDYQQLTRGSLGPGAQAVAAGLLNSPDVGLSWVTSTGLMFNVMTSTGALVKDRPLNVTQGKAEAPSVCQMTNGNFVVVWAQDQLDGESWGIFLSVIDRNAVSVSGVVRANAFIQGPQYNPAVISCEGGFIVV